MSHLLGLVASSEMKFISSVLLVVQQWQESTVDI